MAEKSSLDSLIREHMESTELGYHYLCERMEDLTMATNTEATELGGDHRLCERMESLTMSTNTEAPELGGDHRVCERMEDLTMATNTDSELRAVEVVHTLDDYHYRRGKRVEFEDQVRRVPRNIGAWVEYALWEESQRDFPRARAVWERALVEDYANHATWLKFTDMEMRNGFVNHARNVFERAVTLFPKVKQLWYRYALMEEELGNSAGAMEVFKRWIMIN